MNQPPLEVSAALIFKDGCFLITQRKEEDSFGGFWELPGGKKEPNETLRESIVREIKEELDIEVEIRHFFRILNYEYPQRTIRLNIYLCSHKSGDPKAIECQTFAWVRPKDLPKYKFPDADQSLIRELSGREDWDKALEEGPYPHEYLESIRLFNAGKYYEFHTMLEEIWHPSEGLDRLLFQGLIQAAIALEHFKKDNRDEAMAHYEKACEKWAQLPARHLGVDLSALKGNIKVFFEKELNTGNADKRDGPEAPIPKIPPLS
jgi:8-oxo-dGTP diphosphatase